MKKQKFAIKKTMNFPKKTVDFPRKNGNFPLKSPIKAPRKKNPNLNRCVPLAYEWGKKMLKYTHTRWHMQMRFTFGAWEGTSNITCIPFYTNG